MCKSVSAFRDLVEQLPRVNEEGRPIIFQCELQEGHTGQHRCSRDKNKQFAPGASRNAVVSWDGDDRKWLIEHGYML